MALAILILGAIGHLILWIALINRSHALGIKRIWVDLLTLLCVAALPLLPIAVLAAIYYQLGPQTAATRFAAMAAWTYLTLCAGFCIISIVQRWYLSRHP